ncbi:AAA family ATPase, partial [Acinetobacter baumannii]
MSNDPIICEICGGKTHVIAKHLKEKHPETTYEEYKKQYPDSPLLSPLAQKKMQEQAELKRAKEAELAKAQQEKATDTSTSKEETTVSTNNHNVKLALTNIEAKPNDIVVSKPFHEI